MNTWECKIGFETTLGDKIPDTGADPYTQDLIAPFGEFDPTLPCYQNYATSVADRCGDVTTPWDIPFDNAMSYYECDYQFSPCQTVAMHRRIDSITTRYKMNCNDDLFQNENCEDIIIQTPTTWSNTTIELCSNQKIIIKPTGSLTINNCIVTKRTGPGPNPNCPTLASNGPWNGIYIGNSIVPTHVLSSLSILPGGNNTDALDIKNNSVIEYSNNGIVAGKDANSSFKKIKISNSTMQYNGRIAELKGAGLLEITNSNLKVYPSANSIYFNHSAQINCINSDVNISNGTELINYDASTGYTGINSIKGKITISNSRINGFKQGVYKDLGGQLNCFDSKFYNCNPTAIFSRAQSNTLRKNYFGQGGIDINGNSVGLIKGNTFKSQSSFTLNNLEKSYLVSENYFDGIYCILANENDLTEFRCNRWLNDIALEAYDGTLPMSWGNRDNPSGNKWEGSSKPSMSSEDFDIDNWEVFNNNYKFIYQGNFTGLPTQLFEANCIYGIPPNGLINHQDDFEMDLDLISLNSQWQFENNLLDSLYIVANSNGNPVSEEILEAIEDAKINLGQITNKALYQLDRFSSASNSYLWTNRSGNTTNFHNDFLNYLMNRQWTYLEQLVANFPTGDGVNMEDKINVTSCINLLKSKENQGISIFEFNISELDELIDLASLTHGDYTAPIKSFLNCIYDIRIVPDHSENRTKKNRDSKSKQTINPELSVTPNPGSGIFTLSISGIPEIFKVEILTMDGKLMQEFKMPNPSSYQIEILKKGVYLIKFKSVNSESWSWKKVVVL